MVHLKRGTLPEKREGRARLTVRDPQVTEAVEALQITGFNVEETTRWGNSLNAAVRRWKAGRIEHDRGRISKSDAARLFARQLAPLAPSTTINMLAKYRRDGGR